MPDPLDRDTASTIYDVLVDRGYAVHLHHDLRDAERSSEEGPNLVSFFSIEVPAIRLRTAEIQEIGRLAEEHGREIKVAAFSGALEIV